MAPKSIRSKRKRQRDSWATRLSQAVRQRRRALKLTQIQLAELADCGPAFLYALESGKRTLRLDKVVDVLRVLGLRFVLEPGEDGVIARSTS